MLKIQALAEKALPGSFFCSKWSARCLQKKGIKGATPLIRQGRKPADSLIHAEHEENRFFCKNETSCLFILCQGYCAKNQTGGHVLNVIKTDLSFISFSKRKASHVSAKVIFFYLAHILGLC